MKTFVHLATLAGACALTLTACDSIKDVPNEDAADLPPQTVVLSGEINGLSSLRSITLQNNNDTVNTRSFINAAPTVPNEGIRPVPFSFGTLPVGTAYNITVKEQPQFKNCVVVNGQGTLTAGVRPDVVVNCTNTGTRYSLSVYLPNDPALFKGLQGAKVRVTTEEEIREVAVTSSTTSPVVFNDVLITAPGALNPAVYSVTASSFEGNRLNKCVVTNPTGTNPGGNVSAAGVAPVVGAVTGTTTNATAPACQFTVGGKVAYSLPPGQTTIPPIAGLRLQLRDLQLNSLQDLDVATCTPTNANTTTTTQSTTLSATVPVPSTVTPNVCEYRFTTPVRSSSTDGVYEVAVLQHPVGQFCIVVNGGSASVFTQGLTPPVNVDNANVFCRATPPVAKQLRGVYRLRDTVFVSNAITNAPAVTSSWLPFDLTKQNTASSNMISFFENGTFLYGTHGNGAQVEHGFYDYTNPDGNAATPDGTLRFTAIVDTNTSSVFPTNFSPLPTNSTASTSPTQITNIATTTPGLSALPNPIRRNGTTQASTVNGFANLHAAMTNVALGTVARELDEGVQTLRTLSGTFGADPAGISSYQTNTTTACSTTAPCLNPTTGAAITSGACTVSAPCYMPNYAYRVGWVLEEPPQLDREMTGAWTTQDSRRLFVWDYRTYYGTGVGVMGGSPSMNDACFTLENLHASTGIYTRRGSLTGCFPFARPGNDPTSGVPGIAVLQSNFTYSITPRNGQYPAYQVNGAESVDLSLSTTPLVQLPGYTGRHPGGEPAPQTSSPSPVYFHIAPAATFFSGANATYFPTTSLSWCTTDVLGLRATANGFPANYPLYFCRTRAN